MTLQNQKQRIYSGSFKQTVVEDKLHSGYSFRSIGKKYQINHNLVMYWLKTYSEKGVEALYMDQRGAPGVKRKPKSVKKFSHTKDSTIRRLDAKLDAIQGVDLSSDEKAELERLRMENAYLKKLRALVQK